MQVMIKEIYEQYPSRGSLEKIGKEVAAVRSVLHRYTAALFGACVVLGHIFLCYEWIPAESLRLLLDEDLLPGTYLCPAVPMLVA